MELIIENGVNKWYSTRKIMDFFDSQRHLRSEPSNVRRWMAHLLLTTTVNIIVAQTIRQKWFAPVNHFYDQEMLSQYSKTDLLVTYLRFSPCTRAYQDIERHRDPKFRV